MSLLVWIYLPMIIELYTKVKPVIGSPLFYFMVCPAVDCPHIHMGLFPCDRSELIENYKITNGHKCYFCPSCPTTTSSTTVTTSKDTGAKDDSVTAQEINTGVYHNCPTVDCPWLHEFTLECKTSELVRNFAIINGHRCEVCPSCPPKTSTTTAVSTDADSSVTEQNTDSGTAKRSKISSINEINVKRSQQSMSTTTEEKNILL